MLVGRNVNDAGVRAALSAETLSQPGVSPSPYVTAPNARDVSSADPPLVIDTDSALGSAAPAEMEKLVVVGDATMRAA